MHGLTVFRGTRVRVQTMFDYLENGESLDDFLEVFPTISRALAVQVLDEYKELRVAQVQSANFAMKILLAGGFPSSFCVIPPTA